MRGIKQDETGRLDGDNYHHLLCHNLCECHHCFYYTLTHMSIGSRQKLIIVLVIAGAILRFWNLGFQHMNWDEEFTIAFAGPAISAGDLILKALSQDFTPPLYYLAAHFSMLLFGETATAIRIPSAIAGVILIPVMYLIGKEYKDELFGILLAGFSTIFYNFIFYSRYGRSYSIALLFFSLAFLYFMKTVKGNRDASIPFGIFALLALWTHLYTAIPLGIMILYLFYKQMAFPGVAITVIGSLPLLNYINVINETRIQGVGSNTFGESPLAVILYTPLDLFTYSVFLIFPIVIWVLWKYRADPILKLISIISAGTWFSMLALSTRTPIILHYGIFLVPLVLVAFLCPFFWQISKGLVQSYPPKTLLLILIAWIVVCLEFVQIFALLTIQRGSW